MDASSTSASTRFKNNLTFSSTLLDDIYRSIDQQSTVCTQTSRKKHIKSFGNRCFQHDDDDHEHRASLFQKPKQNKARETPVIVRSSSSTTDLVKNSMKCNCKCKCDSFCFNSNPRTINASKPQPKCKPESKHKHKHKHDEFMKREKQRNVYGHDDLRGTGTDKREGSFVNTKSKVLKMYSDLKKMKQPISPGGRLTTFLNSLFVTGNSKRCDTSVVTTGGMSRLDRKSNSVNKSTCTSISSPSRSRSCLTNTTTSFRGNGFGENLMNKGVKLNLSDENNCVSEAGKSLLRKYRKKVECERDYVEDEDECDDGESDSSSDLFELDNLSPVRIRNDQEELPLYATTNVHDN
ncbi:putative protein BIG GRAIN 1 [Helianthus annuus]|nr:putative protein BIG GRAIN 1 [Helianthus annuus]